MDRDPLGFRLGSPRDSTGTGTKSRKRGQISGDGAARVGLTGAGKRLTLPEGEEDDGLDHEELEDGAIGAEQVPGGKVEEEEGVEGQADGDVVDDGHVEVAAGDTVGTRKILWLGQSFLRDVGASLPPLPLQDAKPHEPPREGSKKPKHQGAGWGGVPGCTPWGAGQLCRLRFARGCVQATRLQPWCLGPWWGRQHGSQQPQGWGLLPMVRGQVSE